MRKFTLFISALLITASCFAQRTVDQIQAAPRSANFKWIPAPRPTPLTGDEVLPDKISSSSSGSVREAEAIIGTTMYDVQTNRAVHTRLIRNSDGTLSAAWTTSCDGTPWPNRGTGYNYFDGTSWLPSDCNRIEPTNRTGFVNIGVTASGKEFSIGHSSTLPGMLITSRPTKGSGAWTEDGSAMGKFPNDLWAQTAVGGPDGKTIHAIWNASGTSTTFSKCGQNGPIVYSRSTDDGATWPVLRQCLSLIDSNYYLGFSADDYAITAQGNNVAIIVGDWSTDLVLLKSTDNGDTWTKTILYTFPIPFFDIATMSTDTDADGTTDIVPVPDGDARIEFDKNGMLHVVFSKVFVTGDAGATGLSFYPDADGGLYYWDEAMGEAGTPPVAIAFAEDLNGDGVLNYPVGPGDGSYFGSGTYGGGLTLQPSIGFDEANNMYVTYSTYDELADTTAYASGHRHVYVISSFDGGVTWTVPFDVVPSAADGGDGENQEAVFASMATTVDNLVHIVYQRDPAPGTSLSNLPVEVQWNTYTSDIVYVSVGTGELVGTPTIKSNFFSVSQNNPNPFNDQTEFSISLDKQSSVNLKVTNVLGQEVYNENVNYSAGKHQFNFSKGNLSAGIYNFTVMAEGEKISKKIIIE